MREYLTQQYQRYIYWTGVLGTSLKEGEKKPSHNIFSIMRALQSISGHSGVTPKHSHSTEPRASTHKVLMGNVAKFDQLLSCRSALHPHIDTEQLKNIVPSSFEDL